MTNHRVAKAAILAFVLSSAAPFMTADSGMAYAQAGKRTGEEADRLQRWQELSEALYGEHTLTTDDRALSLEGPGRAEDAALVPLTLRIAGDTAITRASLIIDDNPSPVAARISFGPAGDQRLMKLRVRIDGYTNVHWVAETSDGRLLQTARFIKAAGGCSAPAGPSDAEAMRGMGEMRLRLRPSEEFAGLGEATLMVRHPNFNGMQMNMQTRGYTPARYINAIHVSRGDETVFSMEADISLSTHPVISFLYKPEDTRPFRVTVTDTDGTSWRQEFDAAPAAN